jgi:adenylate cyclase
MAFEIERKFLINDDSWNMDSDNGTLLRQGYLNSKAERTVRVRISGNKGILTIKGKNENLTRKEFEYQIPLDEAMNLLQLCEKPIIEKTRYLIIKDKHTWEIDVFEGENKGLIVAEIELTSEQETFEIPSWLGKEVSFETKYYNSSLIANPYSKWEK